MLMLLLALKPHLPTQGSFCHRSIVRDDFRYILQKQLETNYNLSSLGFLQHLY